MQAASPVAAPARQVFISFARGMAMLFIVVYHFGVNVPLPPLLARVNQLGGAGIYIFLFASSYGLYFSRVSSWKDFYQKRFQKVLVPYYLGVTLIFLFNYIVPLYPDGGPAYLSHLLLYKMFDSRYMESFGTHFWFISTIVQFYLLWPLLWWLGQRLPTAPLLGLALAVSIGYSLLVFQLGMQRERIWYSSVVQYFWILTLGLVVARQQWLPALLRLGTGWYGLLLGFGVAVVLLLNHFLGERGNVFNDYFMFVVYFSGCVLLFRLGDWLPAIRRFMLWIESFSYSLYIIHLFVFALYLKLLAKTQIQVYEVPVVLALCIVLALGYEQLVNRLLRLTFERQPVSSAKP